jgi:enoyl-[acyl-carrier protein] reductase II
MLRTSLCNVLGIEVPIIQAGMGRCTSAELVAAVSDAGGLGSLGCDLRPVEDLALQLSRIRALTNRPFAVNHLLLTLNQKAFAATLHAKPRVISFTGGDPGDLVARAHDVGSLVIHQVHTVEQALQAVDRGVDAIIAQGGEAGGNSGAVGALALVPQVVDAVRPIPVIAAGGIAEGRGLAAALALGAQAINIGTRFLASREAPISETWKQLIVRATSDEVIKFDAWNTINPPRVRGYGTGVLRVIRTPFVDRWQGRSQEVAQELDGIRSEVSAAAKQGLLHELVPIAGQSAGLVHQILPAAEIVRRIIAEARTTLQRCAELSTEPYGV